MFRDLRKEISRNTRERFIAAKRLSLMMVKDLNCNGMFIEVNKNTFIIAEVLTISNIKLAVGEDAVSIQSAPSSRNMGRIKKENSVFQTILGNFKLLTSLI